MHLGEKRAHSISKRTCSQRSARNETCNLGSVHSLVKTFAKSLWHGSRIESFVKYINKIRGMQEKFYQYLAIWPANSLPYVVAFNIVVPLWIILVLNDRLMLLLCDFVIADNWGKFCRPGSSLQLAFGETHYAESGVSGMTFHREVFENWCSILYSRRGWKQLQPRSRAVWTPVAITTGTGAGLDHSCRHLLFHLPGVRKVKSLTEMHKQASGCKWRTYFVQQMVSRKSDRGEVFNKKSISG